MALQRGDVIDRYQLDELFGAGAFGEVWKAKRLANGEPIGTTYALKVMRLANGRVDSSARTLPSGWLDEAQHLVRVAGSTVPRIQEANVWNDYAYIAMELLEGTTLHARLKHGPIPWRRALFIADQIATALEAAHKIGIIHRDLKPQNVMLVNPRRCYVLDWGIARLHTSSGQHVDSGLARQPTNDIETTDATPVVAVALQPHRVPVGTPGYMAPEVYERVHPSPAQDVYSLGVVLYEMIAGCLPHAVDLVQRSGASPDSMKAYRASLDRATMDHALIPLRERCPSAPSAVAELVDSLLARDPERRPTKLRMAIEQASRFSDGIPDPPYVGLSTMGVQHAGLYFGQHDAIQRVLDHLTSHRAALLWGPSGSGKSSLALAGVAATMDRTLFLDMDGWEIHVVRPREGQGFRVAPDAVRPERPRIGQVIVLDQLEDVVDLELGARDVFFAAVLALLQRSAPVVIRDATISCSDEVRVIATIRDDLEWRLDREAPALRPLLEHRIIAKGVDVNLARSIIEKPAGALGYTVEHAAAVARVVQDCLSAEPAKLPVVQYALREWWERRDEVRKALPIAAWNELGGVDGALSFVAERFFSALDPSQQERLKALFTQLFQGGRKQPLVESALAPGDRLLLEELGRLRLIGRRDRKESAPFYEVEHEYLSTNWARLAGWLAEAHDDRALAQELEREAAAYLRDQDPERVWRKGRLAAAVDMARRGRVVLNETAMGFLQLARRRERRRRFLMPVLVGAGVVVVLIIVYASVLQAAASKERQQARIDLQSAEEKDRKASEREISTNVAWTLVTSDTEQLVKNAEDAARRVADDAARRMADDNAQWRKYADDEIERTRAAQAQLKATTEATRIEAAKAREWAALAETAMEKAQADDRARRAELKAQEANDRARRAESNASDAERRAMLAKDEAKLAAKEANLALQQARIFEQKAKAACER